MKSNILSKSSPLWNRLRILNIALLGISIATMSDATPKAIVIDKENETPISQPIYHRVVSNEVTLHLVSFDSRNCILKTVDQASGPSSEWATAADLGIAKNAIACINAGFFNPDGSPLGLVITNNVQRGTINHSSLGSGFFYSNEMQSGIARKSELFQIQKNVSPSSLLQSGPMLSYRGKNVAQLSNKNSRIRSFLATDGSFKWLIGYAETTTLAQLGSALAGKNLGNVQIYNAINLDGGRSSELWISSKARNGNKNFRSIWNKPVRNFLLLTKR